MYETTLQTFTSQSPRLKTIVNNHDLFIYPNIPETAYASLRTNFKLHMDEEILYARDTSFWNNKNQGTVITDWGLSFIWDNDNIDDIGKVQWSQIRHVEYKGAILYFFYGEDRDDNFSVNLSYFLKDTSSDIDCKKWGKWLADLFTAMAQTQIQDDINEIYNQYSEQYNKLIEENKNEEALHLIESFRDQYKHVFFTEQIAWIHFQKGNTKKAFQILDEDIDGLEGDINYWRSRLTYVKYSIFEQLNDYISARKHCLSVVRNTENIIDEETEKLQEEAMTDFSKYETTYVDNFLDQPYTQRKLFVPVKNYTELNQNFISVLHINQLPSIEFPIGHPIANKLYVGHPFIVNKYIPFENYELEFIEDKIREFCHIMQLLGASEINIACENSSSKNSEQTAKTDLSGNIDYKFTSVQAELKTKNTNKTISNIGKNIELQQKFNPVKIYKLPDNLVWYKNEPSWQRLFNQRMQGGLVEHIEKIETKKSQVIEDSQLKNISSEVKWLFIKANGIWDEKQECLFEAHDHDAISISVKFVPLHTLIDNQDTPLETTMIQDENNQNLSLSEQEYLEELKLSFSDDNLISDRERRLLNRLQQKLGISDERASILERMCKQPQLSKDEMEYLEEYKECMEDNKFIDPRTRRLLDKLAVTLCIDTERQSAIENSYKNNLINS